MAVRQELTVSPWNGLQSVDWTPGKDINALTGARQDIGGSAAHLADELVASEGVTAPVSANREALGPAGMLPFAKSCARAPRRRVCQRSSNANQSYRHD